MPGIKSSSNRSVAVLSVELYKQIEQNPNKFTQKALSELLKESSTRVHRILADLIEAELVFWDEKLTITRPEPNAGGGGMPVGPGSHM